MGHCSVERGELQDLAQQDDRRNCLRGVRDRVVRRPGDGGHVRWHPRVRVGDRRHRGAVRVVGGRSGDHCVQRAVQKLGVFFVVVLADIVLQTVGTAFRMQWRHQKSARQQKANAAGCLLHREIADRLHRLPPLLMDCFVSPP